MSLQEEMIRYRAKNSMSQAEFAKRCGVTLQTINSVEKGHQNPSRLTEAKIRIAMEESEGENNEDAEILH